MPAPYYDDQRYVSEDETVQRSQGSRQYPLHNSTSYARYERYEIEAPSLKARQDDMKGKKVTFCMSGDRDSKGVDLCINNKIRTFGSLLAELDKHSKIKPKGGVRYIFKKDENRFRKIDDLSEIQSGDLFVVSDKPSIDKSINYGFPAGPSPTKSIQRSPLPRRSHKGPAPLRRSVSRKTDTIIVMNKERLTTYKLNPNTTQLFEEVLETLGDMLKLNYDAYKPLTMYSAVDGVYTKIDSFRKLNSQLHVTELKSAGNETPKFLICKNGEQPEDALSEKMRKSYEKKGLLRSTDDRKFNDRYIDDGDEDYVEDGTPEPIHHEKRRERKTDGARDPDLYDKRRHKNSEIERDHESVSHVRRQQKNLMIDSEKEPVKNDRRRLRQMNAEREEPVDRRKQRNMELHRNGASPPKHDEPPITSRRSQNSNPMSKSQSRESIGSKTSSKTTTPRLNGTSNKPQPRIPPSQRRSQQRDDETSTESQQNLEDSDSDSDYPEPRVVEPRPVRGPRESPEY